MIRQGDLLFQRVDKQVEAGTTKRLIVAEGEATGHHHVLVAETDSEIKGDKTLFTLTGRAKLIHPEHDTINFDAGTYMVINEREYSYIEETLKQVLD